MPSEHETPCDDALPEYRHYLAQKVRLTAEHRLSSRESLRLRAMVDDATQRIVLRIEQAVAALPGERIIVHRRWPADWWQALKARWFPLWALKRWPVQWEELHIDQQIYLAVCPHLPSQFPEKEECFHWMAQQERARP